MLAFVNENFVEEKNAVLGISDLAIQRGYGIFDFFRTRNFVPLFMEDHLDRFYRSAAALRLGAPYPREELKGIIAELIRRNDLADSGFKIILTGGYSHDGFALAAPNIIVTQQPVQVTSPEQFNKGIKVILHEYQRDVAHIKSINYLMAIYLQEQLQQQQANDVLYYNKNGVLEFPRANVFVVTKDNTIVSPAENVLHGITRMKILELAAKKYKVEERAISVEELNNAAEVFLTSTTKRIMPVFQVDDITIGNGQPGAITTALYEAFMQLEESIVFKIAPVVSR